LTPAEMQNIPEMPCSVTLQALKFTHLSPRRPKEKEPSSSIKGGKPIHLSSLRATRFGTSRKAQRGNTDTQRTILKTYGSTLPGCANRERIKAARRPKAPTDRSHSPSRATRKDRPPYVAELVAQETCERARSFSHSSSSADSASL
jgi:hypothetical protein